MTHHIACSLLAAAFGSFALGVAVGRAQGKKAKREFEAWRTDVLEAMAQDAKDARNWSKLSDHIIAMDKQKATG